MPNFRVEPATPDRIAPDRADRIATIAELFREYAEGLGVDLSYQGFAEECAGLPGAYAPPAGALLLALSDQNQALGCVAVRPLITPGVGPSACEMKRLHTRPNARGAGIGRALAEAAIHAATSAGYRTMCLDTLPTMLAAHALYRQLGFEVVPPYYASPIVGTLFMRKPLAPQKARP
ncbi:GNAT family N-acetyltransferase [Rhodopila sp.]|uniref:GNAT family N-acetyltransferase n=1 Tax=Rhodopila sp. TaxID=2480087 RepID=UPI003D09FD4B